MAGVARRCSAGAPCIFCGNTGRCSMIEYPDGEAVRWCHGTIKRGFQKGDIISAQGMDFFCLGEKENDVGTFHLWTKYLSKEEWVEKQKKENPDWKPGSGNYTRPSGRIVDVSTVDLSSISDGPAIDEEEVLPPQKIHEILTYFMELLVLEDKHADMLVKEWYSPIHPSLFRDIVSRYPIKSLPPADKARFANGETLKNPTRKAIIAKLLAKFGDLRGVPGFYMRSGSYYESRPESERWTFVESAEGMVFPCYDKNGYLWRVRFRDDYPNFRVKEDESPSFEGKYGLLYHKYDKEGKHTWWFRPDGEVPYIVHSPSVNKIPLNFKGQPAIPCKVVGKYKNFSSVVTRLEGDGKAVNIFKGGSRSGSPYSIYAKGVKDWKIVMLTEGEKKSMVANNIKCVPLVCVPGVSSFMSLFEKGENGESVMDYLKKKGMKYLILCYDADKNEKEEVKKAEGKLIATAKADGIKILLGEWEGRMNKGLDDILIMGLDISFVPA